MIICDEMIKLRKALDEKGVQWKDCSTIYPDDEIRDTMRRLNVSRECADYSIFRTHFSYRGYFYSVIYGYGSYGYEKGLFECMVGGEEPKGDLTANDVLKLMEEK